MDEDEGLEPTPAERLGRFLRSLKHKPTSPPGPDEVLRKRPASTFWREVSITIGLLLLWSLAMSAIPIPIVKWHAFTTLMDQFGWGRSRFSIGTLGLGPYILAHWFVFWLVMLVPSFRRMDFRYRPSLNRYVLAGTFLLAFLQAWDSTAWYERQVSPLGERMLLSYFYAHPIMLQTVLAISLGAALAFTLVVLTLIQRYGIPCPVTCMMIWWAFAGLSLFRELGRRVRYGVANDLISTGVAHRAGWWFRVGLVWLLAASLLLFAAIALIRRIQASPSGSRLANGIQGRLCGEPSPLVFSTLSTGVLLSAFGLIVALLARTGLFPGPHVQVFQRLYYNWRFNHVGLYCAMAAVIAVPSALVAYRLLYNPTLRHRLGIALGLDESAADLRQRTLYSLLIWCGFAAFVILLGWPRRVLGDWSATFDFVFWFQLWDVVLLILTVVLLRRFYRLRAAGLRFPVLSHGYYEPLYAARELLEENGIRSQIWGEPFAMLFGFIVGPIGLKHLLVSEADRDRASGLLRERIEAAPVH